MFFASAIVFVYKGKSYRSFIAMLIFYIIRAILQQLQTLPFPDGFYWYDPGFPSLVNIYGKQSDFFYSGHIGFCIFCTIELFNLDMKCLGFYGVFSIILNFITLISFRIHYTIDLFTGCVMAHYIYYLTGFIVK